MCNKNESSFLSGVAIGTLIGAVLGVLYAPAHGEETRRKLKETGKKYVEKGKETLEDVQDAVEELKLKATPIINDLKETSEPARRALVEKIENLSEEVKAKVKEEKETLRKKYFSGTR